MAVVFDDVSYFDLIKDATFDIETGKITGIIGSSNSGKSTLIDLMSGLISPFDESVIYDDGIDFNDIGVVYQNIDDQFFYDNIIDEFTLVLRCHHIRNINKNILDSLRLVGLNDSYLYRSPFKLSLSEQKRLSLALALSFNPKLILLDEPVMGLDNKEKERFIKLVRLMKLRYGKTIVIASKDAELIHRLSDHVILVSKGKVVKTGGKYDVFTDEKLIHDCDLSVPKVIEFSNLLNSKKGIKMGYRDDINDLMKDIYRFVR